MIRTIVVVGAGQAGSSFVAKLRQLEYEDRIVLVGEEPDPPYQRPPLSKKYLLGELERERLHIKPADFYEQADVEMRLGDRVEAIDMSAREVRLNGGDAVSFDRIALTTGSRPRLLSGAIGGELAGVYALRTLGDVDAMAHEFAPGRRLLIVGGGYIGLETAAVARARDVDVTLIEMADRILQRVASPETSRFFRQLHSSHGVDIREGCGLERLEGEGGRVCRAILADGTTLEVDFVVVGIGIAPNSELAEQAGLAIDNGIAVDRACRASAPQAVAAGDCASFLFRGERIRLESVQNAIDQAEVAAAAILDIKADYEPVPWFWSDQYDVKLQIAGLSRGFERTVMRPGARENAQSIWYYRGPHLIAVDAMNDPRAYMSAKRLIETGTSPAPETIADPDTDLKALLRVV